MPAFVSVCACVCACARVQVCVCVCVCVCPCKDLLESWGIVLVCATCVVCTCVSISCLQYLAWNIFCVQTLTRWQTNMTWSLTYWKGQRISLHTMHTQTHWHTHACACMHSHTNTNTHTHVQTYIHIPDNLVQPAGIIRSQWRHRRCPCEPRVPGTRWQLPISPGKWR